MLYSCSACECNEEGSEGVDCDDNSGKCNCNANIVGDKCTQCAAEHFAFPTCEGDVSISCMYSFHKIL